MDFFYRSPEELEAWDQAIKDREAREYRDKELAEQKAAREAAEYIRSVCVTPELADKILEFFRRSR